MAKYGVDGFGAWALKCNPETVWDLDSFIRGGNHHIEGWSVPSKGLSRHMKENDPVVFWVSGRHASCPPGIWAVGKVTGLAHPGTPDQYWIEPGADFYIDVDLTVHHRIVPREVVKADPILAESTLIKMPMAANPVMLSDVEWSAAQSLVAQAGGTP